MNDSTIMIISKDCLHNLGGSDRQIRGLTPQFDANDILYLIYVFISYCRYKHIGLRHTRTNVRNA